MCRLDIIELLSSAACVTQHVGTEMAFKKEVDVSDISPGKGTTVHGAFVGAVSPIQSSWHNSKVQYFESLFSDGIKTVRMVSFDPQLKSKIESARDKKEEVAISNCRVQKRMNSDEFEIVVGSNSCLMKSPKKFHLDESLMSMPAPDAVKDVTSLQELNDIPINKHVNVIGKVICVESAEGVHSNSLHTGTLMKQDIVLADSTATCRCVVWEKNIGTFDVNSCYKLTDVMVKSFNGTKYLSLLEKSPVAKVEDIGEVVQNADSSKIKIKGEIVGVMSCDTYSSCINCRGKLTEISSIIAQCTKCATSVKITRCSKMTTARLIIKDTVGQEHKVSAFNVIQSIVNNVAEGTDIIEKLLSAPVMNFVISLGILTSVAIEQ